MLIRCPVCEAPLYCLRIDDGKMTKEISSNRKITKTSNEYKGYDYVYCSKNKYHVIPSELVSEVLNLVN